MDVETDKLKLAFAAALLRYDKDQFKAAMSVCNDVGLALQIGPKWAKDLAVEAEMTRLLAGTDASSYLPSKQQQARDVYSMATDVTKQTEDRLKAHRLYAEIMGHIEKPVAGAGVNILNQGVMIVREAANDDAWQEKATKQQRHLTLDANTVN